MAAQKHPGAEIVLERGERRVDLRIDGAAGRIAEERLRCGYHRDPPERAHPAICDALIPEVLESSEQDRAGTNRLSERWIYAPAAQRDTLTKAVRVLAHARQANCAPLAHASADIKRAAEAAPRAGLQGEVTCRTAARDPRHPIQHPADAPATKHERIGALENLDTVDVVEIPVVLNIVAHPIHEVVGRGGVAAEDERIAIALALRDPRAGNVAGNIAETLHRLVINQLARDDRDRLGDVDERRIRLGGRAGMLDAINAGGLARRADLEPLESHRAVLSREVARRIGSRAGGGLREAERDRAQQGERRGDETLHVRSNGSGRFQASNQE